MIIKFSKNYNIREGKMSDVHIQEIFAAETHKVSDLWQIAPTVEELEDRMYQVYCYVRLEENIEDFDEIIDFVHAKLDRDMLAYVANKQAVYANISRRLEEMIFGNE